MTRDLRLLSLAAALLVCTACPSRQSQPVAPASLDTARPAVGLVITGSATPRAGIADGVARGLAAATGRRVVTFPTLSATTDATFKTLATRLAHDKPPLAAYNWKEPRCAGRTLALAGAQADVVAVYRVALEYSSRTRRAEPIDTMRLPPPRSPVGALLERMGLGGPPSVVEETVTGTLTVAGAAPTSADRVPLSQRALSRAPLAADAGIDVAPMIADAARKLPKPKDPRWDTVATKLVSDGCPFLGLAVVDARLPKSRASERLRQAALASMGRQLRAKSGTRVAVEETPAPAEATPSDGPAPEDRYSCSALCGMHMIELCNNDRDLWNLHRARWEATPCGARRPEGFLAECYKQQWLNGTYHDSCVVPCESTSEGHDKLLAILQASGCLRGAS